ncbi:helix-turn-helix transcriptional regulator [Candidatus Woesearchaeota archaeon]|nr:helix-turn-helix transcriptional regulator [Candidatus Woesearchaeota archaeon]
MNKTIYSNLSNVTQKWVELLIPFTGDYTVKLSASELARQAAIPQQTAARYLDKLTGGNLLNNFQNICIKNMVKIKEKRYE